MPDSRTRIGDAFETRKPTLRVILVLARDHASECKDQAHFASISRVFPASGEPCAKYFGEHLSGAETTTGCVEKEVVTLDQGYRVRLCVPDQILEPNLHTSSYRRQRQSTDRDGIVFAVHLS